MKTLYIFILLFCIQIGFSQERTYFVNVGRSIFTIKPNNFDSYNYITSFKVGTGRNFRKNEIGISYSLFFNSIGAYDNWVDTLARLNYIGLNLNLNYRKAKFESNFGPYFSYLLKNTSPSRFPEAYYYYKKTDLGLNLNVGYRILKISNLNLFLTTEILASVLPIYTDNFESRPIPINKETRNVNFSIGIKIIEDE